HERRARLVRFTLERRRLAGLPFRATHTALMAAVARRSDVRVMNANGRKNHAYQRSCQAPCLRCTCDYSADIREPRLGPGFAADPAGPDRTGSGASARG